jgi:hypothetical protein
MADMNRTTAGRRYWGGLYPDYNSAERGIRRFNEAGYEGKRIGVIARDRDAAGRLAEDTGAGVAGGAATGAVAGGILGGLAGLLVGTGALAIPGIGPVVAAGVWASTLGTAGATAAAGAGIGAVAGGLIGALTGMGFSDDEAAYYDRGVREGRYFVSVEDEDEARARRVFDETGAEYWRPSGTTTTTTNVNRA